MKMQDTTLKLLFAGIITVLGITFAFGSIAFGLLADLEVNEIFILTGIFSNIVTAGIVYFLGYSNGRTNVANEVGKAVLHEQAFEKARRIAIELEREEEERKNGDKHAEGN